MAESRKAIHAFLTPASHEAWHDIAAENGVSVSALIEALAQDWAERRAARGADPDADGNSDRADYDLPEVEALSRDARKVDAARRRRTRS